MRHLILIGLLFYSGFAFSQNKTISNKDVLDRERNSKHKVLIVPFEPRLYMGEIDHHINAETKLSAKEIKHKFRDGINEQILKALKSSQFGALDFMDDTTRYKKDLESTYQFLSYDYQKVPNQENYSPPKKEKEAKKIDKGQVVVETDGEKRFMNAKLTNPKTLVLLNSKFKTDIFIFINQLDIKSASTAEPGSFGAPSGKRKITVHYTVFTSNGKEINSGVAEEEFEQELNNPKKIIDRYFSKIANTIVFRVNKALSAK